MADAPDEDWGCYRHPFESAGVKCTRCDRPICPRCMITAPVGFQCPECVKGAPPVRRYSELRRGSGQEVYVTTALIAVNVAVFVVGVAGGGNAMSRSRNDIIIDYGLSAFPIDQLGQWYRLITSGFLHFNLIHIGLNMWILYQLGQLLEPQFGRVRYALVYLAALLGGSVGALVLSPDALTAGASGAVFGLMGAAAVALRHRGINVLQTSIGSLIVINLVLSFVIPGVSVGGHVGGLLAGAAAGFLVLSVEDRPAAGVAAVSALALALLGAGVVIA